MTITWDKGGRIENGIFEGFYISDSITRCKLHFCGRGVILRQVSARPSWDSESRNHLNFMAIGGREKNSISEDSLIESAIKYIAFHAHNAIYSRAKMLSNMSEAEKEAGKMKRLEGKNPITKELEPKLYEMPIEIFADKENIEKLQFEFASLIRDNYDGYVLMDGKYRKNVLDQYEEFLEERKETAKAVKENIAKEESQTNKTKNKDRK